MGRGFVIVIPHSIRKTNPHPALYPPIGEGVSKYGIGSLHDQHIATPVYRTRRLVSAEVPLRGAWPKTAFEIFEGVETYGIFNPSV